ncbi:hypothetical protein [Pseudomonas sp. W2-17]|uniref:hypothetical protein n=1 Tax=Pseudomonas sp. W2-17 TaxID=3058039 RepID=UPI0034E0C85D
MNFENFPAQVTALVIGWSFTVYLQQRSNRRAESLKRKDKIVDKLEELSGWLESEIEKEIFSAPRAESTYSGMLSQIEIKISQLNNHVGRPVFNVESLSTLREVEIFESAKENIDTPYSVRESVADIVEEIESCCDGEYFARRGIVGRLRSGCLVLNDYVRQLRGFLIFVACVLIVMAIYQFYYKYMARPIGTCVYGSVCQSAPGMITPEIHRQLDSPRGDRPSTLVGPPQKS